MSQDNNTATEGTNNSPVEGTIEWARALLGRRAVDQMWSWSGCEMAAEARLRIVQGSDGAGTWAVAIYGDKSDADTVEVIAWQGISDEDRARRIWAGKAERLSKLVEFAKAQ